LQKVTQLRANYRHKVIALEIVRVTIVGLEEVRLAVTEVVESPLASRNVIVARLQTAIEG